MKAGDLELYKKFFDLIEAANALEPPTADETPSTPLVGAMLQTLTNERLIALLRVVRDHAPATMTSRPLSKRSSLFDKLIIMKGEKADWVLRLHTYGMPAPTTAGRRTTNLGEELGDDEENTHFHRWRLSSRFVTGGFNNVTWDVRPATEGEARTTRIGGSVDRGKLLRRFALQATAKSGASSVGRTAEAIGIDVVSPRRTEFYQAGDVIAYPIVDPHSVSMLSPFTGTTMTLAHTGKGLLEDSAFFAAENRGSVQQLSYSADEFTAAIDMAITRLQVIELNRSLLLSNPVFGNLNAFETEVLPRLAEWMVLAVLNPADKRSIDFHGTAAMVGFDRAQAERLIEMDARSLAILIIDSQKGLEAQQFAKDARPLVDGRLPTTDLARQALRARGGGTEPVNLIGKHK